MLLIRRGDNRRWALPGGIMEPGESIAGCIIREVREETGLEVEPVRLVGIYSDPAHGHVILANKDELYAVVAALECRVLGGTVRADGDESLEVAYFDPEALPETLLPNHRTRIQDAMAGQEAAFLR